MCSTTSGGKNAGKKNKRERVKRMGERAKNTLNLHPAQQVLRNILQNTNYMWIDTLVYTQTL